MLNPRKDLGYLFEEEEGIIELPGGAYYGELEYRMQYKAIKGDPFPWLYIDFDTLSEAAEAHGFRAELITMGEHYDYLARVTRR